MSKKKKNKKASTRIPKAELLQQIINIFNDHPERNYTYRQVARLLGINNNSQSLFVRDLIFDLLDEDYLVEITRGKYKLNSRGGYVTGIIDRQGFKTFMIPDDGGEAIFIPERKTNQALINDTVKVFLYARRKGQSPEGEVVDIIKRARDTFVGTLELSDHYAFLISENRNMPYDIFIPRDKVKNAKNGQIVVVKLMKWESGRKNPVGEVIDILGNKGDNDTEMHAILVEYGLPYKYPKKVEAAANKLKPNITPEEIFKRLDMREVNTFTIDPHDAKDFDDALSVRKLKSGSWEIGVHIADVTHYVKPGSIIDKEAKKRGTSVYLVDRTVPMLPERLSNEICSLRPHEDKLCYSILFHMNNDAQVLNYKIVKTVIRSKRRFNYEEAQKIIETQKGDFKNELLTLNNLAKKLRRKRFDKGAINFERIEVGFEIDDKGKPLSVIFREQKDANNLIEEFMLLANKTVAKHIGRPGKGIKIKTFVYRVHDVPDANKLENFSQFIQKFGYKLRTTGRLSTISSSINNLLGEVQGKKEQNLVETLAIRSMAKAQYTTKNIGHYGLAFDFYSHFTSPIRRYPDILVHRLLDRYLAGGKSVNAEHYEELCKHSSDMEQLASNAERSSIKYKQVEFMSDHIGEKFDGVISGVTEWGIYVELVENKCEGLVPIRDLDDDYYTFDERNHCLVGRRFNKKYQLGNDISIRVAKADLNKKQLDFVLAN